TRCGTPSRCAPRHWSRCTCRIRRPASRSGTPRWCLASRTARSRDSGRSPMSSRCARSRGLSAALGQTDQPRYDHPQGSNAGEGCWMRIGMALNYAGGFRETAAALADYEKAGLDIVFVPEAYSYDAVSQLGYLAAVTERVELASGIMQMYSRTPTLTAMTAAGIDYVSDGRFSLGLGASRPPGLEGRG